MESNFPSNCRGGLDDPSVSQNRWRYHLDKHCKGFSSPLTDCPSASGHTLACSCSSWLGPEKSHRSKVVRFVYPQPIISPANGIPELSSKVESLFRGTGWPLRLGQSYWSVLSRYYTILAFESPFSPMNGRTLLNMIKSLVKIPFWRYYRPDMVYASI